MRASAVDMKTRIDSGSSKIGSGNFTGFVQVKNTSKTDEMSDITLTYGDSSGNNKSLHMTSVLQPQKTVKVGFAQVGISTQVVTFHAAWAFEGIAYGSRQYTANPGRYFYSMDIKLNPDGSSVTDLLIQKPL